MSFDVRFPVCLRFGKMPMNLASLHFYGYCLLSLHATPVCYTICSANYYYLAARKVRGVVLV